MAEIRPAPSDFACPRCGNRHPFKEIGFAWPDATRALSIPADEQARIRDGDNEDVLVMRSRLFFVRGWAPLPLETRETFGVGFWLQISAEDFADFERGNRVARATYAGRIANQDILLAPTLGAAATMEVRDGGRRPSIRFTEPGHPFTKAQATGVPRVVVEEWLAEGAHAGEPQPLGAPFTASLEKHGFAVVDPPVVGRTAVAFAHPPQPGDLLKLIVAYAAADEDGAVMQVNAGWWVKLDDTTSPEFWSGTLRSIPRVPSTLRLDSRLWFKPSHIIEAKADHPGSP